MFEIGNSLREARARRKLSYDQVEAETKIRAKYIRCLEEEEYDALPSGTYVKGFLRTYADYLGLDGQLYVDEYNSRFGDSHHEDQLFRRRERPVPRRRQTNSGVMVALAGIVAVAVLFFVAWRFGGEKASPPPPVNPPTQPVQTKPARARNPSLPPPQQTTTITAKTRKKKAHKTVKPVILTIKATRGRTWIVVKHGASGQVIFSDVLELGDHRSFNWKAGFTIQDVPNYTYVDVVVNGKTYHLSGEGPFRVTTAGLRPAGA
jgi:cytoskeleton protein RodZ